MRANHLNPIWDGADRKSGLRSEGWPTTTHAIPRYSPLGSHVVTWNVNEGSSL